MYQRSTVPLHACWIAVLVVLAGCGSDVERDLEDLRCGDDGACLPGYVCSSERICVREGLASTAAGAGGVAPRHVAPRRDAAVAVEAPVELADAGTASEDAAAPRDARPSDDDEPTQTDPQCSDGVCAVACPAGREACAGSCVLLASDAQHCGGCANACPTPSNALAECNAGLCSASCSPGYAACAGGCVDLRSDRLNCGTCGQVCPASTGTDPICDDGRCGVRCAEGFSNCEGQCVGEAVVETAELAGLGSLPVCAAFSALQAFSAGLICVLGLSICDDTCVDKNSDENHCGGCDRSCKNKETCVAGACMKKAK